MEPYKLPHNIPDEHMRMVGIIAAQWEWLELILERSLAEIMMLDPNSVAILTTNIGFSTKCDTIMGYARNFQQPDPAIWKRFTTVFEGLHECQRMRSKFIHAQWSENYDNPQEPLRNAVTTTGKRLTIDDEPTPINDLYEAAEVINKNSNDLVELMQKFELLQS